MTRALFGAVICVVACGKSASDNAAQPGAIAGKVLEVSGQVTANGKPLAVGDAVKTDDTVETGADGNVAIELAHNGARWTLGPNLKKKPTESLAWNQAKAGGSAAGTDQATSAAGRPAERSAAESNTTADESAPRTGAPAPSAAAPAPAPGAVAQEAAKDSTPPPAKAAVSRGMPSPQAATTPAPPPPPPPPPSMQPSAGEGGGGSFDKETSDDGVVSANKKSAPVAHAMGVNPDSVSLKKAFAKCTKAAVSVSVTVKDHVATVSFPTPLDETVELCINRAASSTKIVGVDTTFTIKIN
ncbi:MAG: hypothetical protein QM831_08970 [Kofleriaceae bacterium]